MSPDDLGFSGNFKRKKNPTNKLGKEKLLCLYFVTTENSAKEDNEAVEQANKGVLNTQQFKQA